MRKITKLLVRTLYALLENGGHRKPVKLSAILRSVQKRNPCIKETDVLKALKTGSKLGLIYLNLKGDSVVPAEIFHSLCSAKGGRFVLSACWKPTLWRRNKFAVCQGCLSTDCMCCSGCNCHLQCPFCPGARRKRAEIMHSSESWFTKVKRMLYS